MLKLLGCWFLGKHQPRLIKSDSFSTVYVCEHCSKIEVEDHYKEWKKSE